jgi:hypothetical protein
VPHAPLTFEATKLVQPEQYQGIKLIPFFRLHDARYVLYWRVVSPDDYGGS